MKGSCTLLWVAASLAYFTCGHCSEAQETSPATVSPQEIAKPANASTPPVRLTLQDALDRARKNSTQFQAALTTAGLARQDRTQARNTLLPTVTYNNSAIYTQGVPPGAEKGIGAPVIFIANNAVHEYLSQADVHQVFDAGAVANFRRMGAAAAVAKAQAEIASRGLVVTVVQNYYAISAAQLKVEAAKRLAEEGDRFLKVTQDLENGGEVAHSDVIKAELQARDRQRQFREAQLAHLNARLNLAVLIFPDFNDSFEVAEDLHQPVPLPTLAEVQQGAARDNPDVRAALAAVQQAGYDVFGARAGYFPALSIDYFYGIDAAHFAVNTAIPGDGKVSNLGSSIVATLNIPVWNWGTTQSRVKQAELRRAQSKRELSFAQRKLLAEIQSLYAEAETALNELEGLARSAQLAEESQKLITLRYRNGESTVLEVVDAQTTFAAANAAYQDGAVRYRVALANLQTLTGVLTTP
ncbi:MAG TPA: TolC family protein [Candidatus Saccharimonadales bacterium]|jgi:outer membrane protein TolC|nr:TolC family protein [Candidatus Saccharimonadales bacterium]